MILTLSCWREKQVPMKVHINVKVHVNREATLTWPLQVRNKELVLAVRLSLILLKNHHVGDHVLLKHVLMLKKVPKVFLRLQNALDLKMEVPSKVQDALDHKIRMASRLLLMVSALHLLDNEMSGLSTFLLLQKLLVILDNKVFPGHKLLVLRKLLVRKLLVILNNKVLLAHKLLVFRNLINEVLMVSIFNQENLFPGQALSTSWECPDTTLDHILTSPSTRLIRNFICLLGKAEGLHVHQLQIHQLHIHQLQVHQLQVHPQWCHRLQCLQAHPQWCHRLRSQQTKCLQIQPNLWNCSHK